MPHRRLPNSIATRDSALTACKAKADATPAAQHPFSGMLLTELNTEQPAYHSLVSAMNTAKTNQTTQSAIVAPLRHIARLWVSHGYQALIDACIRGQFQNTVKNLYGLPIEGNKGPTLSSEIDVIQAAITYNDAESQRRADGQTPISFPDLVDINLHVDKFKAENQTQSALKLLYDNAQEALTSASPNADLLVLRLWNAIEATFDMGNKPSLRRKAREWGVVYVPSAGETPSGDDFSVIGLVKGSISGLPLEHVELVLSNITVNESYITTADGMYFMPPVPSGIYELSATMAGYQTFKTMVTVVEGEVQELNITMVAEVPPPPPMP